MERKEKAKGRRQKKAVWAAKRQFLVSSSNRKWTGKRRPKTDSRSRQPGKAIDVKRRQPGRATGSC